jgi:hypothetical protein
MKGHGPHNKGGRIVKRDSGHAHVWMPEHPRASRQGYVREHILVAEKALGKPLPAAAIVHHVRPDESDNNDPSNLVICENQTYHLLLHARTRRLRELRAGEKQCSACRAMKPLADFYERRDHIGRYFAAACKICALAKQKGAQRVS